MITAAPAEALEPEGFDPETSRELVGERERTVRTFQNADGTLTSRFFDEPVNFRDPEGGWKKIDTTLKALPQGGTVGRSVNASSSGWRITAGDSETTFASHADGSPLVSLRVSETESVGFALQGAAHAPGEAEESTVTYRAVRRDADVRFVAGGASVKELLVLNSADAPMEWVFPLHMQGLTASLDATGAVAFADASGRQRARIPAGWMEDSNLAPNSNEGQISSGVGYELIDVDGGQALKVTLDAEWLQDPARAFPVKVDPTVISVTANAASSGTFVESPYNVNFAGDTNIKVGTYDAGGHKAAGFLHFAGVESKLKNAWVLGASLALYNTWSYSCTARPVTVHPVTASWAESTTSTYPGPATGAALASKSFTHGWRPAGQTAYPCGGPAWEGINLGSAGRQLVDDWTHGRKKNYGLAVKASTTDSYGWKNFGSDDYPNGKPSLDVTWTKYGATYSLGQFVTPMTATSEGVFKVTVTNRGQETWLKNGAYTLGYRLYDSANNEITDTSKIRWSPLPADVPPGASVTVDAKIAPLIPGAYTLAWTMRENGVSLFTAAGVPAVAMKFSAENIPPTLTGLAPDSGVVVDTLTPTLWTSATDRDRYPKTLQYQFEVCEVEGNNTRKNCKIGTRSASAQQVVPSGWLTWAKTYAWYAYAYDGSSTSTRPQPSFLTTQVPQPPITGHLAGSDTGGDFGERAGNYTNAATDAAVPTVGPELSVTRTYNSQDPRQSNAFGSGWATRWDMRAVAEGNGSVLVTLSTGDQVRFGRNTDGTYTAPAGSVGVLKADSGGWTLRDRSATLHSFDAQGRLTRITDGHGRVQQLTYTGGQLVKATDVVSGRFLSFTWSGGHIIAAETNPVQGPASHLKWSYSYEGDRLVKVCPPTSTTACTQYTYESGSQYRSMVLDANPSAYWRLNEADGETAVSEVPSSAGRNAGRYRDVTLGAGGVLAATGNKAGTFSGGHVELPDNTLSATVLSVEMWFKTGRYEGVLLGLQDTPLGEAPEGESHPILELNPNGYLVGSFGTGSTPASMTSAGSLDDNQWHHVVLTSTGTSQTLYVDGVATGTHAGPVDHKGRTYTYLGAGYSSRMFGTGEGTRHFVGALDEVAVYHHALDAATVKGHFQASAGSSRLTKVTLPSGRTGAQVTYDSDTERVTEASDSSGSWKISAPSYSSGSEAYESAVRAAAPVNYWRLGDSSGAAAADEISSGADGSYRDGVKLGQTGVFAAGDDTAINFDGTEGAVEVPADALEGATALSIETWFRTEQPGGVLLGLQSSELGTVPQQYTPSLLVDIDGKLRGHLWRGSTATPTISSNTVTDNEWHHVVITGGTTGQSLYLDGVKIGSLAGAVKPLTLVHAYLGAGHSASGWAGVGTKTGPQYFSGSMDETAFYRKELSAQVVMEHYRARTRLISGNGTHYQGSVTGDAPAGFWRFDETSGTRAVSKIVANNGNGTYTKPTLGTTGVFGIGDGSAVQFNGDGYAEIPGLGTKTANVAVELWFRTTKPGVLIGDQMNPLAGATATSGSWTPVLYVGADGKLHGQYPSPGVTPSNASPDTVTDNQWHHAAITADAGTQTLFLDGAPVATKTNAPVNHQSNTRTFIGAGFARTWPSAPADVSYFTGQIDEAAVYQHSLTADQVADHYAARAFASGSTLASTVTVTDPLGQQTSTTYDALRGQRRIASTDEAGGVTTYAYDTGGFLHTVTDANGHSSITGHDTKGNPVSNTTCRDDDSCWTSYEEYFDNPSDPLDPRNGKRTTTRDARSSGPADNRYKTTTGYTPLGMPEKLTLADGRTSTTTYTRGTESAVAGGTTPAGLVATTVTPEGAATAHAYYANGDLAATTTPSGLVTRYTYDGIGRKTGETQISDTHPDGVATTYTYDPMSNVVAETGTGIRNDITGVTHTARISRTHDADGNILSETEEDLTGGDTASTTTYHFDNRNLNDTVTDAEGNTTTFGYDALGRLTSEKDPLGEEVTYSYTPLGLAYETALKNWTGAPSGEHRDLVLESNAYDPAGRLASTTDAMGATTAYTYFDDGLPATTTSRQVEQSDGTRRDIVLENNLYDGAGYLTHQVTDGGTLTQTHTVDATGRITRSVADPNALNRSVDYLYDDDDRVTESTLRGPSTTALTERSTYDHAGNVTSSILSSDADTLTTRHTYDQRGLLLSSVSPRGTKAGADATAHTTNFRYDALGRLVEQTAPAVSTETHATGAHSKRPTATLGYNTYGDTTHSRDENGVVTRTELDRLGRTTKVTLPSYTPPGGTPITPVHHMAYDALGRVTSTTDPLERTTRYAYDQLGHLTQQTDPLAGGTPTQLITGEGGTLNGNPTALDTSGLTRYTWSPTGLQLSATSPTGARTEATYDSLGRRLTATTVERFPTPQNLTERYTWDNAGNQVATTSPSGLVASATYNALGETLTETEPGAHVTRYTYDGLGRQTQVIDPTNRKSTLTYDLMGNVTEAADYGTAANPLRTFKATFDEDGNQTSSTTPAGGQHSFAYDALGRLTQQTEKLSGTETITTSFGYDARGSLTRFTDGRAATTHYTFNTWGLPESTIEPATRQHPNQSDRTWTTIYDAAGQAVTEILPGNVRRERTYDGLGRLVRETGSGTSAATTPRHLSYDLDNRLTGAGSDGIQFGNTYAYNDRGLLLRAQGPSGNSQYTYDADGNMLSRTDAAGTASFAYDITGRLDTVADPLTGTVVQYDFDAAGRPTQERYGRVAAGGAVTTAAQRSYGYDSLGRQTSDAVTRTATGAVVGGVTYGYDLDDHLTGKTTAGTAGAAENTYGYDLAGRMTSWASGATTTAYEWDKAGNLTRSGNTMGTYDDRGRLENWGAETYTYSARGTTDTVKQADGRTRTISSDAFERTVSNGTSAFTYDSLDRALTHNGTAFTYDGGSNNLVTDATTSYTRGPDGSLLASASTSNPAMAQLALTDQHTDLIAGLNADGTAITGSRAYDPFGKLITSEGTNPALGYQSGWTDTTTGEVNMAARWYQPGTGGFTSRDTWQLAPTPSGRANRYAYGEGGPLNGIDPTGHTLDKGNGGGGGGRSQSYGGSMGVGGGGGSRGSGKSRSKPVNHRNIDRSRNDACGGNRCKPRRTTSTRPNTSTKVKPQKPRNSTSNRRPKSCTYTGTCKSPTTHRGRNSSNSKSSPHTTKSTKGSSTIGPAKSNRTASPGNGRTKPTKPAEPQNPSGGKNPKPAPSRPQPKSEVNVDRVQQQALQNARRVDGAIDSTVVAALQPLTPEEAATIVEQGAGSNDRGTRNDDADCTVQLAVKRRVDRGMSGPVCFRAPEGATDEQIEELKDHIAALNAIPEYWSSTGRVSPTSKTDPIAGATTLDEVAREYVKIHQKKMAGTLYDYGVIGKSPGHLPDTTWSGKWAPYCWHQQDSKVNSQVGSYSQKYEVGYRPTGFYYAGVRGNPSTYTTDRVSGTVSRGPYGLCEISRP
ncbi:LamG-like jellyroll fold domain-containing protein [Streptomyces sp. NPDC002057]|uniref:LamG-like jellyroll fold domain-containing protein n=1 Tax=Streptomyces sp. NPDC002057 TaxID=3154664 RepID=UPI0033318CE5